MMPQKFTVCMQYKYEFFPSDLGTDMIFISFENTLYGESVVEVFKKNLTYKEVVRNEWPHKEKIMHHIWSAQSLFTGQLSYEVSLLRLPHQLHKKQEFQNKASQVG